jgi:hypothetical protein
MLRAHTKPVVPISAGAIPREPAPWYFGAHWRTAQVADSDD